MVNEHLSSARRRTNRKQRWSDCSGKQLRIEQLESRLVLDSTAVFSEIMYNPVGMDESAEWIEIYNQLALDIDLSGWSIEGGVEFQFTDDTVLPADGRLVIGADPTALAASGVTNPQGPFSGSLSNGGEELRLVNNSGRVMDVLDYDDGGPWNNGGEWPVGPDGFGATLAKRDEQLTSEFAGNWQTSPEIGGSPGTANGSRSGLPELVFSEVDSSQSSTFFVEIQNVGATPLDADLFRLHTVGSVEIEYALPAQSIDAGGYLAIDSADMNYTPVAGDRVVLVEQSSQSVLDARRVADRLQGTSVEHGDRWLFPATATPGQANDLAFVQDVVINEIFYHAPTQFAASPVFAEETLIEINDVWRYNESGEDLGSLWQRNVHAVDNLTWFSGNGLLAYETSTLSEPIGTELTNPQMNNPAVITYYFEKEFEFAGDPDAPGLDLQLRRFIDDGAVFFLNGVEIWRFNMPEGPVNASDLAASTIGNATSGVPVSVSTDALLPGTNRLSVEVHQASSNSSDIVFGVELVARENVGSTPYLEPNEEWIELFHRGNSAIDLSGWRIEGGVDFVFPRWFRDGARAVLGANSR